MVKQRFLVLFRRWLFTMAKVFGPILLFEGFVLVRQYLRYAPFGILDLLMGVLMALAAHGPVVWALGVGRMVVVETAQTSWFRERASAMLPELLEPAAGKD